MTQEIVIIAAIHTSDDWEIHQLPDGAHFLSGCGYWHTTAANQCLAVVQGLQSDQFTVKVITTATSESAFARALKHSNLDLLLTGYKIDYSDAIEKEIRNAYGVFMVTDTLYDQEDSVTKEVSFGRTIAEACLRANVKHVIYSTHMHVYASIGLRSDPCDAKAHVADHLTASGIPKTLLVVPFFYEDFFFGIMKPRKTDRENVYKIVAATGHVPFDSIRFQDYGDCVRNLFRQSKQWIGKTIALSGDKMALKDYTRVLTNCSTARTILDAQITPEDFMERNDWDGAEDLANYFDYLTRCVQRNNLDLTMSLTGHVISFYDWAQANRAAINKLF